MTTLEKAHKLIEKGKHRADWFEPSAEVVLATTAKETCEGALRADRQHIAEVLCDLLEYRKHLIHDPHRSDEEEEYIHNLALEQAQALIRQTLDPISSNER